MAAKREYMSDIDNRRERGEGDPGRRRRGLFARSPVCEKRVTAAQPFVCLGEDKEQQRDAAPACPAQRELWMKRERERSEAIAEYTQAAACHAYGILWLELECKFLLIAAASIYISRICITCCLCVIAKDSDSA